MPSTSAVTRTARSCTAADGLSPKAAPASRPRWAMAPGSIRGDYAIEMGANMVHGSDSPEAAEREAALFFGEM